MKYYETEINQDIRMLKRHLPLTVDQQELIRLMLMGAYLQGTKDGLQEGKQISNL